MDQRAIASRLTAICAAVAGVLLAGAAQAEPGSQAAETAFQSGKASWYGPGFHGRRTASGERFNSGAMTAAHRTLPFGSRVRVVNKKTGRSVVVRINDRGPYAHGRIIDLSRASAEAIGLEGVASVALARL
jgi:rare lipoprotein A